MAMKIDHEITMEEVRRAAQKSGMIFYGANTCWWTTDREHLYRHSSGLPCDPRGGMLFQTDKPEDFLKAAEQNIGYYGKYGLRAFLLAYHGCVVVRDGNKAGLPTCGAEWEDYEKLLDEAEMEGAATHGV